MIFYKINLLSPTLIACRISFYEILCVRPRQLPLPIKILYEILYVEVPQLAHY